MLTLVKLIQQQKKTFKQQFQIFKTDVFNDTKVSATLKDTADATLVGDIDATVSVVNNGEPTSVTTSVTIKDGVLDTTLATNTLAAGEYTINVNIPESTSYNAAVINAKLTINKRSIQNTIPAMKTDVFTDADLMQL